MGGSLPHLIEFYNGHPELRDKFEILALHESRTVKTFEELDEKNAPNERDIWKTKLPFPVLIDKDNQTVARYGITGYPTLVLIDPEGNQVKAGNLDVLKEKLGVQSEPLHPPAEKPPLATLDQLSGSVVDIAGQPVSEAEIARWYFARNGELLPQGMMKVDTQGKFSWKVQPDQLPLTYIVLDKSHTLGRCIKVTADALKAPLKVVLKPLAEVRFTPMVEDDFGPVSIMTSFGYPDMTAIVVQGSGAGPFQIPEGEYQLNLRSPDLEVFDKPFAVKAGEQVDLRELALKLSPAARNTGKPALPIDLAEARGVPPTFKLDDLKGKWVLLEFWGFW